MRLSTATIKKHRIMRAVSESDLKQGGMPGCKQLDDKSKTNTRQPFIEAVVQRKISFSEIKHAFAKHIDRLRRFGTTMETNLKERANGK